VRAQRAAAYSASEDSSDGFLSLHSWLSLYLFQASRVAARGGVFL
jgi:hypothetical protein